MRNISTITLLILMCTKSWGQFDGSYTGNSFEGKKVLIKVKTQASIMIGTLYESKSNAQSFFGNIENNVFSAPINFKNIFNTTCTGEFKNDSLLMKIYLDANVKDKYATYSLKKNNKSVDLDKYFYAGEKTYPLSLVGTWKSLNSYHLERKEFTIQPSHKFILGKNGILSFIGNQIDQTKFNMINPEWYVIDNEIYNKFQVNGNELDFGQKYVIKGDTLVLTSSNVISKYIKLK